MNPFYYRTIRYTAPVGTLPSLEILSVRPVGGLLAKSPSPADGPGISSKGRQPEPVQLPKKDEASADIYSSPVKTPDRKISKPPDFQLKAIWETQPTAWMESPRRILALDEGTELSKPAVQTAQDLGKSFRSIVSTFQVRDPHADPAQEILRHATQEHASLLVMATHGRKGKERVVSGSVTEVVVKEAACDVLVVKQSVDWGKIRRILVPLDGSMADFQEIAAAAHLGAAWGAECWLFHVQTKKGALSGRLQEWGRWMQKMQWENIESLESEGPQPIAEAILESERLHDIDLILMGTHHEPIQDLLLPTSVCLEVLRGAKSPVWIQHPYSGA